MRHPSAAARISVSDATANVPGSFGETWVSTDVSIRVRGRVANRLRGAIRQGNQLPHAHGACRESAAWLEAQSTFPGDRLVRLDRRTLECERLAVERLCLRRHEH